MNKDYMNYVTVAGAEAFWAYCEGHKPEDMEDEYGTLEVFDALETHLSPSEAKHMITELIRIASYRKEA